MALRKSKVEQCSSPTPSRYNSDEATRACGLERTLSSLMTSLIHMPGLLYAIYEAEARGQGGRRYASVEIGIKLLKEESQHFDSVESFCDNK